MLSTKLHWHKCLFRLACLEQFSKSIGDSSTVFKLPASSS